MDDGILLFLLWHLVTAWKSGHFVGGILVIFILPFRVPLPPLVGRCKSTLSTPLCTWSCEPRFDRRANFQILGWKICCKESWPWWPTKKLWNFVPDFVLRWRRHWAVKRRNDCKKRVGEDIFIDTSPKSTEQIRNWGRFNWSLQMTRLLLTALAQSQAANHISRCTPTNKPAATSLICQQAWSATTTFRGAFNKKLRDYLRMLPKCRTPFGYLGNGTSDHWNCLKIHFEEKKRVEKNIATGEMSPAITPCHFFGNFNFFNFHQ